MKLNKKSLSKAKHVLLFGPPKSGKTKLAGDLSKKFNLLWFDLENGVATLFKLPDEQQERIEVLSIPDTRGKPVAISTALKAVKGEKGSICDEHGAWNCPTCKIGNKPVTEIHLNALSLDTIVVWDSLTQLSNSAMAHIAEGQPETYKFQFDDWGNLGKLMDTFLSYIQQAPYHTVCITHETEVEMEDGKSKLVPTAGSSKFSRNTAKYFDEVVYCEIKLGKHIAASGTTYSPNILTGSRVGHLLEKSPGNADLLPIFEGLVATSNPVTEGTPATAAVSNLAAKLAAMKGSQ